MAQQRTVADAMNDLWKKGIKPKDDARALINSPTFTGEPKAPTPAIDDDSTRIATTAYVVEIINNLVGAAPETLNTLAELAAALKNNPDVITNILNQLSGKLDIESNAGLTFRRPFYTIETYSDKVRMGIRAVGSAGKTKNNTLEFYISDPACANLGGGLISICHPSNDVDNYNVEITATADIKLNGNGLYFNGKKLA